MDYAAHYNRLIERARDRELAGYVERHHVIPRCLGGSDERKNIVALTAEEHFVAHQLLVKMHPDKTGLVFAMVCMSANRWGNRNNKMYGWHRRRLAQANTGRFISEQVRTNMSRGQLSRTDSRAKSPETRAKMSAAAKGRVFSEAHRAALAAAKMGNKNRLGGKKLVEA